ncbi:MAG: energy-coupling factor ABC transporter ATP-binding protein [Treponemataceae bacterium]
MELISVQNLTKIFYPHHKALVDVSFQINKSDFIVIGGANGSGKSVLMSILAGLDEQSSGRVIFNASEKIRIGLIFQDADAQILGETCEEDILFGVKNLKITKNEQESIVVTSLQKVDLLEKRFAQARFLSGGEKRRLSVASILALQCDVIIFDEPFANLDWNGVKQVCKILHDLKAEKKTVLVLTHEIEKILSLANRFLILFNGSLVFDDTPVAGLEQDIESWGIRNPLLNYSSINDLWWGE